MDFYVALFQYGSVGLLAAILLYLLLRQYKKDDERDARLITVIENNTVALTKVHETINNFRGEERHGRRY